MKLLTLLSEYQSYEEPIVYQGLLGQISLSQQSTHLPKHLLDDIHNENGDNTASGHTVKQAEHQNV